MRSQATGIYVDLSPLQGPFFERGIPRYVSELARALLAASANIIGFGLAPELPMPNDVFRDLVEHPLCGFTTLERMEALRRGETPFVVLLTSPFEGFPVEQVWRPELVCGPEPVAMVVYDTIPLRYPDMFLATVERRRFYEARVRLLKTADYFLAISESAKRELVEDVGVDPASVTVIGIGVSDRFVPPEDSRVARSIAQQLVASLRPNMADRVTADDADREFVVCIGGWTETKNIDRLIEAWALFVQSTENPRHDLVLVCRVPEELRQLWTQKLSDLGVADSVVVTGKVTDDELLTLYQGASLFICPSLHEGFGLPLAEAIRCGVLSVGSNVGPIAEQLVHPSSKFDPYDTKSIWGTMKAVLVSDTTHAAISCAQQSINQGFDWRKVALSTSNILIPNPK